LGKTACPLFPPAGDFELGFLPAINKLNLRAPFGQHAIHVEYPEAFMPTKTGETKKWQIDTGERIFPIRTHQFTDMPQYRSM